MSKTAAIATILYGSFGLKPPAVLPAPVAPERFVTLTAAPLPRQVPAFHPDRLLLGGALTPTKPRRRAS